MRAPGCALPILSVCLLLWLVVQFLRHQRRENQCIICDFHIMTSTAPWLADLVGGRSSLTCVCARLASRDKGGIASVRRGEMVAPERGVVLSVASCDIK